MGLPCTQSTWVWPSESHRVPRALLGVIPESRTQEQFLSTTGCGTKQNKNENERSYSNNHIPQKQISIREKWSLMTEIISIYTFYFSYLLDIGRHCYLSLSFSFGLFWSHSWLFSGGGWVAYGECHKSNLGQVCARQVSALKAMLSHWTICVIWELAVQFWFMEII